MKVLSHLNDATVTVKLKEELWSLSRGNTAAESAGNAWESKGVKTNATRHCASRNTHDVPLKKTSCWKCRLKQEEISKSMKYQECLKHYQKFLERPYYRKHLNKISMKKENDNLPFLAIKYPMKKENDNLPFLAMTICNNFLLIEALGIVIFNSGRRKDF